MVALLSLALALQFSKIWAFDTEALIRAEPIFPIFNEDESLLRWERQDIDEAIPGPTAQCTTTLELKLGDFGTVTSPNYPRHYPSAQVCEWVLVGPPHTKIEATFFDIFTQPWFFAYFDYVLISRQGNFKDSERFFGDLNDSTPKTILSTKNQLGIRFRSSIYFNFRGFKLHYVVIPETGNKRIQAEPLFLQDMCGRSYLLEPPPTTTPIETTTEHNRQNSNSKFFDRIYGKVVGGQPAQPFSYPWMAALLVDGKNFCGGSLIDRQHILTAAHCTDGAKKISVVLGSHNLKSNKTVEPSRYVVNVTSTRFFQHPEYNRKTVAYDIAVIRLPMPINFTKEIQPICLPSKYYLSEVFNYTQVRVAGWGKVKDQRGSISSVLQHVGLTVLPNGDCRKTFHGVVTGNNICVETKPRQSPCKGDSGGPLMAIQSDPHGDFFMQIGIVSFGTSSCEKGQPVGFTRVTAFLDYISKITGRKL